MFSEVFKNFKSIYQNKELLIMLVKRDLTGKYKGSYLGFLWSFITPLLLVGLYSFVFGLALKVKWLGYGSTEHSFTLMLFSGLIFYIFLSETFIKCSSCIITNPNFVKKVIFPLDILIWTHAISSFVQFLINLTLLLILIIIIEGFFPIDIIMFPIIMLPLFIMTLGISFLFATINVFYRDLSQIVGFISTLFLFMSPVFYPITNLPIFFQNILKFNPITIPIIEFRNQIFTDINFNLLDWSLSIVISIFIYCIGYKIFEINKKRFSDEV